MVLRVLNNKCRLTDWRVRRTVHEAQLNLCDIGSIKLGKILYFLLAKKWKLAFGLLLDYPQPSISG